MDIDNTSYNDLNIFHHEEEFSVFNKLNFTRTVDGRAWLLKFFSNPFSDHKQITETQQILQSILQSIDEWPISISNGTMMVIEKFYDSQIDSIPSSANFMNALTYKVFHTSDFSLVRYSISHFADFFRGMNYLIQMFDQPSSPLLLRTFLHRASDLMNKPVIQELAKREPSKEFSWNEIIHFGNYIKDHFRHSTLEIINIYGRLDAWYSMAFSIKKFNLSFPVFIDQGPPLIDAQKLYHILLTNPVPYDVHMSKESNFLFLTGANMAGKSTFIKSVGAAVFLAHLGMGVPAENLKLTLFDGLLSNINVVDNIVKGESYFFNEVQRVKNTILKINNGKKWLVLIDELFKGTNVQDAMKCSSTVIKGLMYLALPLLSTSVASHPASFGNSIQSPKILPLNP